MIAQPILLINPNSNPATTDMMLAMARAESLLPIRGITATRAPRMITTQTALDATAAEVIEIGHREAATVACIIVAAFGDPGAPILRQRLAIPVIGICEAAMREAGAGGRRFAVATTTPGLVPVIDASAAGLGLGSTYAGTWLTSGDAASLTADPQRLESALADAVAACLDAGAEAVIIGGGPLSAAAAALADRFAVPIIAPVAAAARWVIAAICPS